ncbi:hypothetical protein TW65_09348 [Stemphylium lycopersici]|uniref:Uncharacterized protein n=1 Tax=Stemphylium lycopersici TaxID=183478 RepID=A0A364MT82_STELY|nr:hypothetical protein TW65_09348 [Stemphylium lycopersici]RAR02287.1 hypothetical protein DDE83_008625 [Stemphylium lycopersici]
MSTKADVLSPKAGIELGQESWTVLDKGGNGPVGVTASRNTTHQATPNLCPFWLEFPRFDPDAEAPFVTEFEKLANLMCWSAKMRQKQLTKALAAEIEFHGGNLSRLERWQSLCSEVGVGSEPASITQCKKALQSRFVNLFNLVDHRRNRSIQVVCFSSFKHLYEDIRNTGKFPRDCAKRDGCMKALLRRV